MVKINNEEINLKKYPLSSSEFHKLKREIEVTEFVVKDFMDNEFDTILKQLLYLLLDKYKLYLIYFEREALPKNRMRTFKKMFYSHKSKIGENNLYETEIDLEENKSILSSIITLKKENINYCLTELKNSNLVFGFGTLKGKRSFKVNRQTFLKKNYFNKLEQRKMVEINLLKSINQFLNKNRLIFKLKVSGRDEEIIEFFLPKDNEISKRMIQIGNEIRAININ